MYKMEFTISIYHIELELTLYLYKNMKIYNMLFVYIKK